MKQLKISFFKGTVFVLILGTLSHFLYKWTGASHIIGFFAPVSESVWEHMKLLFFPMLLYTFIIFWKYRNAYPCLLSSLCLGILLGTLLIPALFYFYTALLGHNVFILDIAVFVLSTVAAFFAAYKLTVICLPKPCRYLLYLSIGIFFLCFVLFTYHPPDAALFADPAP
ncbi:MAG: hypothetical protein HFI43_02155 [Lachnospiraceae bacterium]|nr:hypothetical protein [Lachnospiraceae bacterium]